MTSSVKPEVRNASQRSQRRTEPRPTGNIPPKNGEVRPRGFELCERTDT